MLHISVYIQSSGINLSELETSEIKTQFKVHHLCTFMPEDNRSGRNM